MVEVVSVCPEILQLRSRLLMGHMEILVLDQISVGMSFIRVIDGTVPLLTLPLDQCFQIAVSQAAHPKNLTVTHSVSSA